MYRNMVFSMAVLMVALGAAMIGLTIAYAGFGIGIVLGMLFIAAGSLRIWMLRRRPR
jgi:hypothetical protein